MSNHRTSIVGDDGAWQAKCSCDTRRSPLYEHRWEADDWIRAHVQIVARARSQKNTRLPKPDDDWKPGDPAPDGSVDVPLPLF